MTDQPIHPAATVVLTRQHGAARQVLMGQRGAAAVFMPSKYVFPGGRVDAADHVADALDVLDARCQAALAGDVPYPALVACALRELAEETGLTLARPRPAALQFVFRAITPPGRSRRFDARFFLADLADFTGDAEAFSAASDELTHLHWISLTKARDLDLPFITEVVLAEVTAVLAGNPQPGVPFFDNAGAQPMFRRL